MGGPVAVPPRHGEPGAHQQGFHKQEDANGWSPVHGPERVERPGPVAGVDARHRSAGTARTSSSPSSSSRYDWTVRFESVNYRTRVWVNGKRIGTNRGAYIPFEFRIPRSALKRGGTNRMVVRVENIRKSTDLPPSGFTRTVGADRRLVELRRDPARGLPQAHQQGGRTRSRSLPDLPCRACAR